MKRNLEDLEDFMSVIKEQGITEAHYSVESQAQKENVISVLQLTAKHPEKEDYYLHRTLLFNGIVKNTEEARKQYQNQIQAGTDNIVKEFQRYLPSCKLFRGWVVK